MRFTFNLVNTYSVHIHTLYNEPLQTSRVFNITTTLGSRIGVKNTPKKAAATGDKDDENFIRENNMITRL